MRLEARYHPEGMEVDAAGVWDEGHAHYPGRSVILPRATDVERRRDGLTEVSRSHSSRPDQTMKGRTCQKFLDGYSDCLGQKPRKGAFEPVSSGRNP
jgi:hypothetical protein